MKNVLITAGYSGREEQKSKQIWKPWKLLRNVEVFYGEKNKNKTNKKQQQKTPEVTRKWFKITAAFRRGELSP